MGTQQVYCCNVCGGIAYLIPSLAEWNGTLDEWRDECFRREAAAEAVHYLCYEEAQP